MTLPTKTKWFGVNDAKVALVLTDVEGGSTTYDDLIDVPGIKSVGVTGDVNSTELRGDGKRLDQSSALSGLSFTFEGAKQDIELLAALVGGTVSQSGTTPNQIAKFVLKGGDQLAYFKFQAMTLGVDTGLADGRITLPKCILTSFPGVGFAEEDYQTFSVEAACMPLLSNDDVMITELHETLTAIA